VLLRDNMRMGTVNSDLIAKVGYDHNTMRVIYTDGAAFDYFGVSLSTYKALLRSKHLGTDWLELRDQYKFKRVN
jgi:KTSC domain